MLDKLERTATVDYMLEKYVNALTVALESLQPDSLNINRVSDNSTVILCGLYHNVTVTVAIMVHSQTALEQQEVKY